jgi:hypothetical protein
MTSRLLVLGFAFAFALAACAKSRGTETGNPPVIAPRLIGVEAIDEAHVRVGGSAGAISPGGGEVSVTNTSRDGDPVVVDVAEDGSFSVELEGSPDDDYEVVAINADGSSPPRVVSSSTDPPPSGDWQTLHECDERDPMDELSVTELRVEGDTLYVGVGHGGGCAQHRYGLCYGDAWATSNPVQVGLQVLHDDGGDRCEAYLSEELSFDLTPFKAAYETLFGAGVGAASLGVASCTIEGDPAEVCRVLYTWGDASSDCGPPIGPLCPPFELPDAPAGWVEYPTECRFSFRGPDDLIDLDVQGIDSCVDEFANDACTFQVGSGGFSSGLADFEEAEEYVVGQAAIQGYDAKLVTAVTQGDAPSYFAAAHFPQPPFATGPGVTADFLIRCSTREQRDAMLPSLGTIRFD